MKNEKFCLMFSYKGGRAIRIPLDELRFLFGRSPICDLVFDDEGISRKHFEIRRMGTQHELKDLSKGQTNLNGQSSLSGVMLEEGDNIDAGGLSFVYESMPVNSGMTAPLNESQTRSFDMEKPSDACATLSDGKSKTIIRPATGYIIGTAEDCHVRLEDDFASRRHCQIIEENGRYFLRDLDSSNGTRIGDLRIFDVELPTRCEFTAGRTHLVFERGKKAAKPKKESRDKFGIVGEHPSMVVMRNHLRRLAPLAETVLVEGETGCGKELVARALHELSGRSGPFVPVNCGAIARDLIESELFGHVKGAFTGATVERKGAFELASGGTIFLDEIGEMPLELQPKLLRILDSGELRRVGASRTQSVDTRVVAATNRDLRQEVFDGRFREDLFFRLSVLPVKVPPLRSRREDVRPLVRHFLKAMSAEVELTPAAWDILIHHHWPGNVRELRNVLTASVGFHPEAVEAGLLDEDNIMLTPLSLADEHRRLLASPNLQYDGSTLADMEASLIREALEHYGNNKRLTSRALGISKSTLYDKIKKYSIG